MLRAHIKLMTDEKTVHLNITDLHAIRFAEGVDHLQKDFVHDLTEFFEDVIDSNDDGGMVDLTPENAVAVLGAENEEPKSPESTPQSDSTPSQTEVTGPSAETAV